MNYKKKFIDIYNNFGFGNMESRSGAGSTLINTDKLREVLKRLIRKKGIKTVVDIPCGDFHWMKEVVDSFEEYFGGDIVPKCIEENNRRYGSSNIKFSEFDIIKDEIPEADLLIVRDIIGHLPLEDGANVVNNIFNSKCKYLLSTTFLNIEDHYTSLNRENKGVDYGEFYPVNLTTEPFNFPKPDAYIIEDVRVEGHEKGNRKVLALWNLEKMKKNKVEIKKPNKSLTIVTGLWNIGRQGRSFNHYIESFKKFLDIPQNLFIYIPEEYEYLVWEKREKYNTFVKVYELEDIKRMYSPFWEKTQEIRNSKEWSTRAGWLSESPQAVNEWYNPIVQSKMFLVSDVSIWNPFDTEYFFWLDAGITNTVPYDNLVRDDVLSDLIDYGNPFLFLSYPYEANNEIHGFEFKAMNKYAGEKVEYVCRGGLFGGHKDQIKSTNATYYTTLFNSLNEGYMGTEESIFAIMSYREPHIYNRYALDGNGLIGKFTEELRKKTAKLVEIPKKKLKSVKKVSDIDVTKVKTNLYILTFNFPDQLLHTLSFMKQTPEWLEKPDIIVLDNSTDNEARRLNVDICKENDFEYVNLGGNTGICGGRQKAAEHFDKSGADFMLFFEDDMTINSSEHENEVCRNGFRKYIPNLYNIVHKIMIKEKFDFLKLSFTEVYFDNDKQCSWYNVPQSVRTENWPHYDKLPVTGLDPNVPLTDFKNIRNTDGVTYIDGEVYYANWPMIVSKEGNKKMFLNTTWAHPFEQTWMSHMYQLTKKGEIKPAVLLASPIWHDRIKHYDKKHRIES